MPRRHKATKFSTKLLRVFFVPLRLGGELFKLFLLLVLFFSSCQNQQTKSKSKTDLIIFHAGSLSVPFLELEKEFERLHPDIDVVREAAGSIRCARKITDLQRDCDIIASADYKVIEDFLIPKYADSVIHFATNEMVIVFHEKSRFASKITANNWYEVLQDEQVKFGRSDPNSDPCGYRTILCMKLAEKYYLDSGITEKLIDKDSRYIRPKASDLIALLEIGELDYVFEYKSIAEQFGFPYLELADSINLSNPDLNKFYNTVSIEINGKKPGELITQVGEAMIYGISILKNSTNLSAAQLFLDFLFSESGTAIMEKNGQKFIDFD